MEDDDYAPPKAKRHTSDEPAPVTQERKTVETNKAPLKLPSMEGRMYPPNLLGEVKTFREYYTPIKSEPKTLNMANVMKNRHTFNASTAGTRASTTANPKDAKDRLSPDKVNLMLVRPVNGINVSGYDQHEIGRYTKSKIETAKLVDSKTSSFLNSPYNTVLLSILATSVIVYLIYRLKTA